MAVDVVEHDAGRRIDRREIVQVRDGVAVLAVFQDGTVPLVRQYRQAVDKVLLEIPAGVREPDEPALEAAHRELSEETGAEGGEWIHLLHYAHAEGYSTGWMDLFLARDVRSGESHPDPGEDLEIVRMPLREVLDAARRGGFSDAKTLLACSWAAPRLGCL